MLITITAIWLYYRFVKWASKKAKKEKQQAKVVDMEDYEWEMYNQDYL